MFSGYGTLKSVKYYICQTGSMQIWMSLQMMRNRDWKDGGTLELMEIDYGGGFIYKDWIRKNAHPIVKPRKFDQFPYEVNKDCRCRDCRYYRIFRGK